MRSNVVREHAGTVYCLSNYVICVRWPWVTS